MTKADFFKMLDDHLQSHSFEWDRNGQAVPLKTPRYTAIDFVPHCWSETPERQVELKALDSKYPWVYHSSGYVLGNCWYITIISHKTAKAAQKQYEIFARWIAEYKALNK